MFNRRFLSVLITTFFLNTSLFGIQQPPVYPVQLPVVEKLKILVLQGQNAASEVDRLLTPLTVIEVRDENDRLVENAEVTFRLPPSGSGGSFAGGKQTLNVKTNSQGQAGMSGFVPNKETGPFEITVTVMHNNLMGKAVIRQMNVRQLSELKPPPPKKNFWQRWKWPIIAGAAAGAGLGIYLGTRSGPAPTIIISPGTPGIGGPR